MNSFRPELGTRRRIRRQEAALLLILLLAFGLRVYRLGALAIWWDESLSVYRATRDLQTVLSNIILVQQAVTYDTLPPLYFALLHFLLRAAGTTEYALRFLSLAANVATLPLLYGLGRQWFSPRVGLVAAFLGALSPFYVSYAQEARPYTLVLFLSTLAVYALTRAFGGRASNLAHTSQASRGWLLVYILAAAGSLYTHYYAVFLIPFHAVLIALLVWPSPRRRIWILLPALPLALAAALLPLIRLSMAGNQVGGPEFVPLLTMLPDLLNAFSVGITADYAQMAWIDFTLLAILVVGIVFFRFPFRREGERTRALQDRTFLLAYALIPVLGLQIVSYWRPLYQHSRYLIAISPAFYLGVALGIVTLARRRALIALPALGIFLVGATLSLNNLYNDPRYAKDDHRAWADYLQERVRPGDFLILDSPHTEELFQYYARDRMPWQSLPVLSRNVRAESPAADLAAVTDAYRRYARVWFLEMAVPFDDAERRIEKLLNQEGVLLDQVDFRGTSTELSLSLFVPALPTGSEIPHPLDATFDGKLRLLGFGVPASIESGGRAVVDLYWQLNERVGEDYGVSLRLVDDAGARWGQWDAIPLGNRRGTSTWLPAKTVVDAHDLPVLVGTRAGSYQLQVQVYHAATGAMVGDPLPLGPVEVTRPRVAVDPSKISPARRVDQTFGAYRLIGSDWPAEGARPGDLIPVALYFQVVQKPSADLELALELVQRLIPILGPAQTRAQARTNVAARGLDVGDIVRHNAALRVPPAVSGDGELRVVAPNGQALSVGDVRVQPFARATTGQGVAEITHPQSARVGDGIAFLGYDVSATRVRAGETLRVTLYWRADKTLSHSYKVFTHVVDADNQIFGQQDSIPAAGTRPTTGWAPGELIVDPYALTLSDTLPPGQYSIEIGFYDETTGERLPTFDAQGAPLGDRILLTGIQAP